MGKQIHLKKIEDLFEKSQVVEFKSIERVVGVKNKSNYAKLLVSNLLKKRKIKKVGKGIYTKHNESSLAVFAFNPAYLGLQSALSYLGIWEQEVIPVIITSNKVRRGIRKVMGTNIFIRNVDKRHFFGFEFVKEGDFYLPYSDLEKTFIDLIVFNQKVDKAVLKNIKRRVDIKKLDSYLKLYSPNLRRRIGRLLGI
jgi:predicted transcriptional regulator of viral defense system